MGRRLPEAPLRVLEAIPGLFLFSLGTLCIVCVFTDAHNWGTTCLALGGGGLFAFLGATHVVSALRGQQQFFRREPLPGPKVVIDEDGAHVTDRGRACAEDSRPRTPPQAPRTP